MLVSIKRTIMPTDLNRLAQMRAENLIFPRLRVSPSVRNATLSTLSEIFWRNDPVDLRVDSRKAAEKAGGHTSKKRNWRSRAASPNFFVKVVSTFDSHITRVFSNVENR